MARGQKSEVGEVRVAQNGYHYTKTDSCWRLTHHLIAERKLGRAIADNERVCFEDNDRTNLSEDNIVVRPKKAPTKDQRREEIQTKIEELRQELEDLDAE